MNRRMQVMRDTPAPPSAGSLVLTLIHPKPTQVHVKGPFGKGPRAFVSFLLAQLIFLLELALKIH